MLWNNKWLSEVGWKSKKDADMKLLVFIFFLNDTKVIDIYPSKLAVKYQIFFILANDMATNDRICVLLQKRQEQDIRALEKSINEFRSEHQRPEDRREFDIYDPDGKKKDKPARISDDDPRCGISSMQKFLGEDLNDKARKKLQQEQNRYLL